jgi:penicillin-binding protein 1A
VPYAPDLDGYQPGQEWTGPDPGESAYVPPQAGERWEASPRPRRRFRWLRVILIGSLALVLLCALIFTGLILATPSVSNAPDLARDIAQTHNAVFPGPPVPSRFADSLTATEDHRFYSEPGVDVFAVARVIRGRLTGAPDQGGATLYQQLAKMLYTQGQSGAAVEVKQVMLGIKLNFAYSKAQILQMYADVAYFGHGYYGLPAASCGYFGKVPSRLSWPQAAMLAGLVQAPTAYNPLAHYAKARSRQAHVLQRLVAVGTLTRTRAAQAFRQPLHLVGGPATGCT